MESSSNAAIMSLSGEKPRRKRTLDDKACEVCNDKSTGKHYGVYCCDGCSGFFKRTVRRSIPWLCRNNNQCIVDRASRTDCRACRFKKCLMVNMNPEGVQNLNNYRASYERTITRQSNEMNYSDLGQAGPSVEAVDSRDNDSCASSVNPSYPVSSPPVSMALADDNSPDLQHRSGSPVLIKVETEQCDTYIELDRNSEIVGNNSENVGNSSEIDESNSESSSAIVGNTSTFAGYNSEIVGRVSASRNRNVSSAQVAREATPTKTGMVPVSQPVGPVMPTPQRVPFTRHYSYSSPHYLLTSPTPRSTVVNHDNHNPVSGKLSLRSKADSVHNMAVQLLSNSVQFAKNIPSFKSLPFRDQIILLEESWKDMFLLDAVFWPLPLDVSCIVPPGDGNATLVSSLRGFQELITRIQALDVDETECACLKTVVLFKPEIKGLKDSQQIERHQNEALVKLSDYVRATRLESSARNGRLLLTLAAFERISQDIIEKLFFRGEKESVEYILHDLFKKT